jgi:hypothetical protein
VMVGYESVVIMEDWRIRPGCMGADNFEERWGLTS